MIIGNVCNVTKRYHDLQSSWREKMNYLRYLANNNYLWLIDFSDENVSKMDKLEQLRQSIADGYAKFRTLGDKWEVASKKYLEKTEEFSPLHIKVIVSLFHLNRTRDKRKKIFHFRNYFKSLYRQPTRNARNMSTNFWMAEWTCKHFWTSIQRQRNWVHCVKLKRNDYPINWTR